MKKVPLSSTSGQAINGLGSFTSSLQCPRLQDICSPKSAAREGPRPRLRTGARGRRIAIRDSGVTSGLTSTGATCVRNEKARSTFLPASGLGAAALLSTRQYRAEDTTVWELH